MKKILLMTLLALNSLIFADCYFQTRRTNYEAKTKVRRISCSTAERIFGDIYFYDGTGNNYARYYGQAIGKEGNLIAEDNGRITMTKFYYALGEFRYYGFITYSGANVVQCKTTTSTGYCDHVEYTEFGNYLRDFLSSPARKSR